MQVRPDAAADMLRPMRLTRQTGDDAGVPRPASAGRAAAVADWLAAGSLALLALLCATNSFFAHLTPDSSTYLLHARTFVREVDRFTLSHDSKGLMLVLALAPAVRLLGPTRAAAACAHIAACAAACVFLYRLARVYAGRRAAAVIALCVACAAFSHYLWGGNARPEDFALAYCAATLYAAWRGTPRWRAAGGALAACCLFTKTPLALTPAAVLAAACVADAAGNGRGGVRQAGVGLLWAGAGFAAAAGLLLAWIAAFDGLPGWYRQTIAWPAEQLAGAWRRPDLRRAWGLVRACRLEYLLIAGTAGLALGGFSGHGRLSALAGAALAAELLRTAAEGASWPYLLTVSVAPMALGAGLLAAAGPAAGRPARALFPAWTIPLGCLLPMFLGMLRPQAEALDLRIVQRLPSPFEQLAAGMRKAGYRPGESVFAWSNDLQILLLLDAPRPAPVLPVHYHLVSPGERLATRRHYEAHPPDWVVAPAAAPPEAASRAVRGGVDYAYHVVTRPPQPAAAGAGQAQPRAGNRLSPMLPAGEDYVKAVDTGLLQAWRRVLRPPRGIPAG